MEIEQAIIDLQARIDGEFSIRGIDDCKDMKLGMEGLKRIQSWREALIIPFNEPLPGETERIDNEQ